MSDEMSEWNAAREAAPLECASCGAEVVELDAEGNCTDCGIDADEQFDEDTRNSRDIDNRAARGEQPW